MYIYIRMRYTKGGLNRRWGGTCKREDMWNRLQRTRSDNSINCFSLAIPPASVRATVIVANAKRESLAVNRG